MTRPSHEIFNAYAQIALDQGLISEAEEETNPRYDSKTLSDIEILYGLKPNGDDDILDKAHPKPVIIAPAYDRVNGLVENLKEQHNIMCGIARKPNNALLTQHRYVEAKQNLLNEVIKIGFLLDNQNDKRLMLLADSCSQRLVKTANPLIIAAIIAGIIALTSGGAAIYSSNNPKSQGIKQNAQRTLTALSETLDDYPQLKMPLAPVVENLGKLVQLSDSFIRYNDQLISSLLKVSSAKTSEEKRNAIAKNAAELFQSGKDKEILHTFEMFKQLCDAITESAPTAIHYLRKAKDQYESADPQVWRSIKDFWQENVVNSDAEDAARMLTILSKSVSGVSAEISEQIANLSTLKAQVGQLPSPEKTTEDKPKAEIPVSVPIKSSLPSWG